MEIPVSAALEVVPAAADPVPVVEPAVQVPVWPEPLLEDFNDADWPELATASNEDVENWAMKNKRLLMRVVTWNLCAQPPPPHEVVTANLLPPNRFHLYIIGTEECERSIAQSALNPSKRNWESYLRTALGPRYVPLRSHTLQAIHLMAFIHEGLAHVCSLATSAAVATGAGNTLGNKGAVGLMLRIAGTKVIVVNAHFAAHQHAVKQRNAEFHKISAQMLGLLGKRDTVEALPQVKEVDKEVEVPLPSASEPTPANSTTDSELAQTVGDAAALPVVETGHADSDDEDEGDAADGSSSPVSPITPAASDLQSSSGGLVGAAEVVVFMGDLNYRIAGTRRLVDQLLAANMHDVMLANDQLTCARKAGAVFQGFTEPPLGFRPTYKYDLNSSLYDSGSKARIPAWTDRVLYSASPSAATCLAYNSEDSVRTSDHRPVYASFLVALPGYVQLDAQGRPTRLPAAVKFTSESQVCSTS